ncbi:hypothetical protein ALC56_15004 [Trachymyrmex septentrionalis]|uniref:Endonuclease/exonuclease/phosphatase domain-containing protein n=1 Tax=Trachymyrmex septentrionalis TaxID=34720 RepID=A0A151JSX9_9HYME|nr:hypothetical protein ALC56_15004 [Trachymyrmex septentrionalis]
MKFIKESLEINVNIRKASKVQNRENKCTMVVKVENWEEKREIMITKKNLKARVFIDNDLTRREREMQKQLKDRAKEEKEKGNNVKVSYEKIFVKDKKGIMNGSFGELGGWTYIRGDGIFRNKYVIGYSYVIANDRAGEEVKSVVESNRIESDHKPLEMEMIGYQQIEKKERKKTKVEIKKKRRTILWKIGKRIRYNKKWKGMKRELRRTLKDLKKKEESTKKFTTWSIRERLFKDDFRRRIEMFNLLMESIALYRAEVWDWLEDRRLDGIKRKYVK